MPEMAPICSWARTMAACWLACPCMAEPIWAACRAPSSWFAAPPRVLAAAAVCWAWATPRPAFSCSRASDGPVPSAMAAQRS